MWETLVELVRLSIVGVAHVCAGSLGSAVLLVSFGLRIALLPLTLRVAREARVQQAKLATLRPAIDSLKKRYATDPARMLQETQALYRAQGIRLFSPRSMLGMMLQAPLFAALFSATRRGLGAKVRFLWIAELSRPDVVLAWGVSALTAVVMAGAMQNSGNGGVPAAAAPIIAVVIGIGTLVFLWSASSAVALSVGAGSLASALQAWLLARDGQRAKA